MTDVEIGCLSSDVRPIHRLKFGDDLGASSTNGAPRCSSGQSRRTPPTRCPACSRIRRRTDTPDLFPNVGPTVNSADVFSEALDCADAVLSGRSRHSKRQHHLTETLHSHPPCRVTATSAASGRSNGQVTWSDSVCGPGWDPPQVNGKASSIALSNRARSCRFIEGGNRPCSRFGGILGV